MNKCDKDNMVVTIQPLGIEEARGEMFHANEIRILW